MLVRASNGSGGGGGGSVDYTDWILTYSYTFNASTTYSFTDDYDEVWVNVISGSNRASVMKINGAVSTFPEVFDGNSTTVKFENVKKNDVYGPYGSGNTWSTKINGFKKS